MPFSFWKDRLFNLGLLTLVVLSFCFYAPCFYPLYNSDHAIHALMSYDLEFPRDLYYWGQNRLGSLLPMLTYPFVKLFRIQPLFMVSIMHYLLLLIPVLIISKFIKRKWILFVLFLAVFFPVTEYRAVLWIGHPYSQQIFCGALFLYFCYLFYSKLLKFHEDHTSREIHLSLLLYQFLLFLFFALGAWVSELSAILILVPFFYLVLDNQRSFPLLKKRPVYPYMILCIAYSFGIYALLSYFKQLFPNDPTYDAPFFFSAEKIELQFAYMRANISDVILMRDDRFIDNLFYYVAFLLLLVLLFSGKKNTEPLFSKFNSSLLLVSLITFILLFFSVWNLRSHFCTRYYIPVYYLVVIALLFAVDRTPSKRSSIIFAVLFSTFTLYHSVAYLHHNKGPGAYQKFSEFKKLPQGTLIAGYWDAYLVGSVAYRNLIPMTFDRDFNRNSFALDKALANANFYFINNPDLQQFIRRDTLWQYSHPFIYSGKKYNCNGIEVLRYVKAK
jgi:hypothetical protein